MPQRRWERSRFDRQDTDPTAPLFNLVDLMLVFACGLIAALALGQGESVTSATAGGVAIEKGRDLPEPPRGAGQAGSGFEPVGQVYRDSKTGKLILVEGQAHDRR